MNTARFSFVLFMAALFAFPSIAAAAPEEIQVYMDELNAKDQVGLDIHVNDVLQGVPGPAFPGGEPSLHRVRITPEWSLGLGNGFEAGAYLPMATIAPDGSVHADGIKVRMKWLAPHTDEGFYWGANYEVGYSDDLIDDHHWNDEVKLIAGWRNGRWLAATNLNFDSALSGPNPGPTTLDLDEKVGYHLSRAFVLGLETYNGLGPITNPGDVQHADQSTFIAADTHVGRWDLNAGIGRGYGGNIDRTIIKLIISPPIGPSGP